MSEMGILVTEFSLGGSKSILKCSNCNVAAITWSSQSYLMISIFHCMLKCYYVFQVPKSLVALER